MIKFFFIEEFSFEKLCLLKKIKFWIVCVLFVVYFICLIFLLIVKMNSFNNVWFYMEIYIKRNLIWKNNIIMKCKEKRGINMSDFILCDKVMRMSWVKVFYCDWRVVLENDV